MRIFLESLGCPKNAVDAEKMGELLRRAGHRLVSDPTRADCIIVNTCGFIEPARQESLRTLRELAAAAKPQTLLVAAGCLPQREGSQLLEEVPELKGLLGTLRWHEAPEFLRHLPQGERPVWLGEPSASAEHLPGPRSPTAASAYVKIADGCSAPCAFCTIPRIKGPYRSRPEPAILEEVRGLVEAGVREIVLIAQDTTAYGLDRGERDALPRLLERLLEAVPALPWLRLMYAYPGRVSEDLIRLMAERPQILHYLDIPLQHAHPDVLRRMRRPSDVQQVRRLLERLRQAMPDVTLRTTFIVGYPGETEEAFETLLQFVQEVEFDRLGAFPFSPEPGTPAAGLPDQVPDTVKQERYEALMQVQQAISLRRNQAQVGRTLDVLTEGTGEGLTLGRTYRDAPEIDGWVLIPGERPLGEIVPVRITAAMEYDLWGEVLGSA
ncbi:MAG: 30S ribosomal protein S12 methylthiotransferase RimO [Anaerolineae bacterium]